MNLSKSGSREYTYAGLAGVLVTNPLWGLADVCVAIIGRGQVVTWVHSATAGIFLCFLVVLAGTKLSFRDFLNAFPIGLQRAIVWAALFYAFQTDNPAIGITIMSFSTVVSIVVFGPMLGEKLNPKILAMSSIAVVGVLLTSLQEFGGFAFSSAAIACICVLPISSAGTYVLRNVQKKVPANASGCYMFLWVAVLYTPLMPFIHPRFEFTNHEILILIILMVAGGLGHFIFGISQNHTTFRFNAIATTLHTPMTALFSWWFISKTLHLHQIIGMIIVISVVAYLSIVTHPKEEELPLENFL